MKPLVGLPWGFSCDSHYTRQAALVVRLDLGMGGCKLSPKKQPWLTFEGVAQA